MVLPIASRPLCVLLFLAAPPLWCQRPVCVVDRNRKPLPDVSIIWDDGSNSTTDAKGIFRIKERSGGVRITHLGFESRSLTQDALRRSDTVLLQPNTLNLEEITVVAKRKSSRRLFPEPGGFDRLKTFNNFAPNFGCDLAVFVPNKGNVGQAMITKILVGISKRYKGPAETEFLPFLINLWTVDKVTRLPALRLIKQDVVARKANPKGAVEITLEEGIPLPPEGVFVVVTIPEVEFYSDYSIDSRFYALSVETVLPKRAPEMVSYYREHSKTYDERETQWMKNAEFRLSNFRFGIEIIE